MNKLKKNKLKLFLSFLLIIVSFLVLKPGINNEDSGEVCINHKEIKKFDKPVDIVWITKIDGCLVGCSGASFTKDSGGDVYARFAGYYSEQGKVISEDLLKEGTKVKVYGKWTGIGDDYSKSVFENKCVPIVQIEKLEIVK